MTLGGTWLDSLELRTESNVDFTVTAVYTSGSYNPMLLPRQLHQGLGMTGPWSTARLQLSREPASRLSDEAETQLMRAHHGQPSQPAALLVSMETAIRWLTDLAYQGAAQQLSTMRVGSDRAAAAAQRQQQHSRQQSVPRGPRLPPIPGPAADSTTQSQQQPLVRSRPAPQLQPSWVAAVRRALKLQAFESCPFLHRLVLAPACFW